MFQSKPSKRSRDISRHLSVLPSCRELELSFVNLQEYEDHAKKLYKEVKRYEECVVQMHKLEQKMSSEMSNSPLCHDDEELKKIAEDYQVG